ncbi:MAG TPA: DNA repair protein RadC [Puia sp.]|jgi:DNA repair protein RadC
MQPGKTPIKGWAKDDRPREKLLSKSPEALSNSELLAIIIGVGTPERNVIELARDVLRLGRDDLRILGNLPVKELMKIKGIGQAKALTIAAALELGKRREAAILEKTRLKDGRDAAAYLQLMLKSQRQEVFAALYLNNAGKILHFGILSRGGLTGTIADPRIIFRKALEEDATSIILCHNHPSGNLRPSRADEELTCKIKEAAKNLDIRLLDHIIVSDEGYYSFADSGLL